MKKILKLMLCIIIIIVISSSNTTKANASSDKYYHHDDNNKPRYFEGNIEQKYDFYENDAPKVEDFVVNGFIIDTALDEKVKVNGSNGLLKVYSMDEKGNVLNHFTKGKDGKYYVYMWVESKDRIDLLVTFNLPVNVVPFNSKVKQNITNGQVIKRNSKTIKKLPKIQLTGANGRQIEGEVKYSQNYNYYNLIYGYNNINWIATPGNKSYGKIKGNFTIYREPEFKLELFDYYIYIQGLDRRYHEVKVDNGKWQTTPGPYVSGLKSNTKYNIQIRQKANKTRKATILKVYNIKTPKA